MSNQASFRFSIDLESEIRKITRRQHLNQVHYLVQMVRHALSREPETIHIRIHKRFLSLTQDGSPFPAEEWRLLRELLAPGGLSVEAFQAALGKLEENHGITYLSLLMNAPHLEIQTGDVRLVCHRGRIKSYHQGSAIKGYTVRLVRERPSPGEEAAELKFYCSGASLPVYLNGKKINRPFCFDGQFLILSFRCEAGHGAVGLPIEGDLRNITLFKQGVRLGVKQSRPDCGLIFHGWWSSSVIRFESDYRESIEEGELHLASHVQQLYRQIGSHFSKLRHQQKTRVKKLLLGLEKDSWQELYGNIPLFHSCGGPFALSLNDLLRLSLQFDAVPFSSRSRGGVPFLPRLLPEDTVFLHTKFQLETRLCRGMRRRWRDRLAGLLGWRGGRRHYPDMPFEGDPAHHLLLRALNRDDIFCRFGFTRGPSRVYRDQKGRKMVLLEAHHPLTIEAVKTHAERPEALPLMKYRLRALAE